MKVLVIGGAGFIGSHIVDQLIAQGDEVIIMDNLSTGKENQLHTQASFYNLDITSPDILTVFEKEKPEVVIHQAAQIHVQTSVVNPIFDANINIMGTINLLEACRKTSVKKFIYASSAAIYGTPIHLPITEDHPIQPLSGYGISKFTPEMYLSVYQDLYDLSFTILRYGNVYGIRQDPRGEGGVISIFLDKILQEQPLTIDGDGMQTRDFIYVEDVARANIAAIHKGDGEIFNVGTGIQTSLNELISVFKQVSSNPVSALHGQDRPGDIKHSYFDIEKIEQHLDWKPQVTLEAGLINTFKYYEELYRQSAPHLK
ncbi:NAD-dependent epimerase/dehydratase family protein [Hazenella sp. IB182353]|uniref:NAD-dependent epimerase/dehydratase family protein n=1 Tax=Polycladospora coralii TaxID=2771432 RepID=UPI0017468359|nr:NAD-dependent epimerase/dehydratase family protein [Polycladospora coralii]MBS7530682.1 NAD-dependent epimerase/dehydratase family protein [Polycladospora coralii]